MAKETKVGEQGTCRCCGRMLIITFKDGEGRRSVMHEPPTCEPFARAMGRPPDRTGTVRVIPLDVDGKTPGEA